MPKRTFLFCLVVATTVVMLKAQEVKSYKARLIVNTKSVCGEGAIWDERRQTVHWIDIEPGLLHEYFPSTGEIKTVVMGQMIGTVVTTTSGENLVVALSDGLYLHNIAKKERTLLVTNEEWAAMKNRFNDGKCDPSGRLWVGTMGKKGSAALYRFDGNELKSQYKGVSISNGIVWSADRKTMYYIDTPTGAVKQFAYNDTTGEVQFEKVAVKVSSGGPDGMCIDSEGMLWIALWGGYGVGRYNPQTGEMIAKVEVPSRQVTSCCFGGEEMKTLYITSAAINLSEEELTNFPHSGGFFEVKTEVKGVISPRFLKY